MRRDLGRDYSAKLMPIRHDIGRGTAARNQSSIGARVASSATNRHAGSGDAERVLGRLQAENDELRDTMVRLALEIQQLRQRA